ncbi:unnamed protein product [Ectocarpus sp. 12 AP-2014]
MHYRRRDGHEQRIGRRFDECPLGSHHRHHGSHETRYTNLSKTIVGQCWNDGNETAVSWIQPFLGIRAGRTGEHTENCTSDLITVLSQPGERERGLSQERKRERVREHDDSICFGRGFPGQDPTEEQKKHAVLLQLPAPLLKQDGT